MLEYSDVREGKFIVFEGAPYEVLSSHVFRKQMRKPVNATKLKNLMSGKVVEHSFAATDKVEEADIMKRPTKYLYNSRGQWWFCNPTNPALRFSFTEDVVGKAGEYMKANTLVDLLIFTLDEEEKIIGMKVPIKVDLKVIEAPPGIKGDTARGGNKQVVVETGASISAPLFVNEGDIIRINTETGEYVERVTV